jgi:hypothetical protein
MMFRYLIATTILAMLAASCSVKREITPIADIQEHLATTIITASPITSATSEPTIAPSPTPSPSLTKLPSSAGTLYEPNVELRCPGEQVVDFDEFVLDTQSSLLLMAVDEPAPSYVYRYSGNQVEPLDIPPALETGEQLQWFFPSDDGESIILRYESDDGSQSFYWISDLNGRTLRELISSSWDFVTHFSGDYVTLFGNPLHEYDLKSWQYFPLYAINIETGNRIDFPLIDTLISYTEFFIIDDSTAYLGFQPFRADVHDKYLYNYATGQMHPIFQWLDDIEGWYFLIPNVYPQPDGYFMTYVGRPYGFDISLELDMTEMMQAAAYDEMMRRIDMPGEASTEYQFAVYLGLRSNPIPILGSGIDSGSDKFYMFDYRTLDLIDYCLEGYFGFPGISVNGRYLSMEVFSDEEPYPVTSKNGLPRQAS